MWTLNLWFHFKNQRHGTFTHTLSWISLPNVAHKVPFGGTAPGRGVQRRCAWCRRRRPGILCACYLLISKCRHSSTSGSLGSRPQGRVSKGSQCDQRIRCDSCSGWNEKEIKALDRWNILILIKLYLVWLSSFLHHFFPLFFFLEHLTHHFVLFRKKERKEKKSTEWINI